jgi:Tfp pilus assembly protein PilZ
MKRPLIAVCYRDQSLVRLANILQQMGYRTECCPDAAGLADLISDESPGLLIFDQESYADQAAKLIDSKLKAPMVVAGTSVAALTGQAPHDYLPQTDDVDAIHELLKRHLDFSREHLRIAVRLPGLYSLDGQDELCNIASLGTGGVFLQTQSMRLGNDHRLQLVIPLLGMKRELEVSGQVMYQVLPTAENNYRQGIGVQFTDARPADFDMLKSYISFALLNGQIGIENPKSYEEQSIPSAPMLGMAMRFS